MTWSPFVVAAGVVVFSLIEYVHHRHVGHHKLAGERLHASHQRHHADAQEGGVRLRDKYLQRAPLVCIVALAIGAPMLIWLPFAGVLRFVGGMVAGYLYSEAFHHRMHHALPRGEWQRWLWRVHYHHHYGNGRSNFGFTSPIWDFVFGTLEVPNSDVRVPPTQAPRGLEHVEGFALRRPRPR